MDQGSEMLLSILEKFQKMTVEEYNKLYKLLQRKDKKSNKNTRKFISNLKN